MRRLELLVPLLLVAMASDVRASPLGHGVTPAGQPGVLRVASATPAVRGAWHIALTGGYGWSPDVLDEGDQQQIGQARLALGYSPFPFLAFGLTFDGEIGSYEGGGTEESVVVGSLGDISLSARTGFALGAGFSIGLLVDVWFPAGRGAFDAVGSAISPTVLALVSFMPERVPLGIHFNLGYRYDASFDTIDNVAELSPAHLLLSGVTLASSHLLADVALEYRFGPVAPFVEAVTDVPLGNDGPSNTWAMLGIGLRAWLGPEDAVQLTAAVEIGLTGAPTAPDPAAGEAWYAPPLVGVGLGASFRLPVARAAPAEVEGERADEPVAAPAVPPVTLGQIRGSLRCNGAPCGPGTLVRLEESGFSPMVSDGESGEFATGRITTGVYQIRVTAPGYEPLSQPVEVVADEVTNLQLDLIPSPTATRPGIRGQVVDFDSNPIRATVRIPALDLEVQSAEDGTFAFDVEPGQWDIVVTADGYRTQHSRVEVAPEGVVVMNVEMRRR
jgi:RNase P/RNase MRP subunit p29